MRKQLLSARHTPGDALARYENLYCFMENILPAVLAAYDACLGTYYAYMLASILCPFVWSTLPTPHRCSPLSSGPGKALS